LSVSLPGGGKPQLLYEVIRNPDMVKKTNISRKEFIKAKHTVRDLGMMELCGFEKMVQPLTRQTTYGHEGTLFFCKVCKVIMKIFLSFQKRNPKLNVINGIPSALNKVIKKPPMI
jgi:hypothetical protein